MNPTVPTRIWDRDHTLWPEDASEISDRLGWLDAPLSMLPELDALDRFARETRAQGIAHIVLLGLGGSTLGPEVLGRCLATSRPDANHTFPELIVLDSTIPARIRTVAGSIDPARTLFLVSSKSGTTIESNMLYRYFRRVVEDAAKDAGESERAGDNFVAITDAGTPLDELARQDRFRRVFRNPPEIGGRYSVLSLFGLVPAALIGFDTRRLLQSAVAVRADCGKDVPAPENAGASLGAAIADHARAGRDKLTILTSPALDSFGLWAEQLIAESLGKSGRGVIPVVGEPIGAFERPSDDRLFVYIKLAGDDSDTDALADRIASLKTPLIRHSIEDVADLGGEFFRWQFATATAGALLGVHPFDQPDVQRAKDFTENALRQFEKDGIAPGIEPQSSLMELLDAAKPGDYLAILAYMEQTPQTDVAFADLRASIAARHGIPTTVGYGPRYLHSTGQLHKGGPNNILALFVTAPHQPLPIPNAPYDFATLANAQAAADIAALQSANRPTAIMSLSSLI